MPLDGGVVAGASDVDQAPITGESVPVARRPATRSSPARSTATARSRSNRPSARRATPRWPASSAWSGRPSRAARPSEQWVERFARVYTPVVIALALRVFVVPPLAVRRRLGRVDLPRAGAAGDRLPLRARDLDAGEHRRRARRGGAPGVLIKGGALRRGPARLRASRSTRPARSPRAARGGRGRAARRATTSAELLERAAALEARSDHPLARAILEHAESAGVAVAPGRGLPGHPGKGATGHVRRPRVLARLAPLSRGARPGDAGGPRAARGALRRRPHGRGGRQRRARLRPHRASPTRCAPEARAAIAALHARGIEHSSC